MKCFRSPSGNNSKATRTLGMMPRMRIMRPNQMTSRCATPSFAARQRCSHIFSRQQARSLNTICSSIKPTGTKKQPLRLLSTRLEPKHVNESSLIMQPFRSHSFAQKNPSISSGNNINSGQQNRSSSKMIGRSDSIIRTSPFASSIRTSLPVPSQAKLLLRSSTLNNITIRHLCSNQNNNTIQNSTPETQNNNNNDPQSAKKTSLKFEGPVDMAIKLGVFSVTGSATLFFVRPFMTSVMGLEGSMIDGPWSYRIVSVLLITPCYSALLVLIGALVGRYLFFREFALKPWMRILNLFKKRVNAPKV